MNKPFLDAIVSMIMEDFKSNKYKPVVIWNRTDHNAPFTYRNYTVIPQPIFKGL